VGAKRVLHGNLNYGKGMMKKKRKVLYEYDRYRYGTRLGSLRALGFCTVKFAYRVHANLTNRMILGGEEEEEEG